MIIWIFIPLAFCQWFAKCRSSLVGGCSAPENWRSRMKSGRTNQIKDFLKSMKSNHIWVFSVCLILTACTASAQTGWSSTNRANLMKKGQALGVAVLNGKLYAVGGYCGSHCELATTDVYDPASDTWTNKANMHEQRYAPAAASLNGNLYAIGGQNESGILRTVERYD